MAFQNHRFCPRMFFGGWEGKTLATKDFFHVPNPIPNRSIGRKLVEAGPCRRPATAVPISWTTMRRGPSRRVPAVLRAWHRNHFNGCLRRPKLRSYQKTSEIAANPKVELWYLGVQPDQVRITAPRDVTGDPALPQNKSWVRQSFC